MKSEIKDDIDYNKGAVYQVRFLGENYEKWVNKRIKTKSIRMFDSEFWEYLSKTSWYMVPLIWWPIILFFVGIVFSETDYKYRMLFFISGMLLWVPIEYFVHKYVFHFKAETPFFISFHFMFHGIHHKTYSDPDRLVMPILISSGFTATMVIILYLLFGFSVHENSGFSVGGTVLCGFGLSYTIYDIMHYLLHHKTSSIKKMLSKVSPTLLQKYKNLHKHHMNHHFLNHERGYGVTNTIMDCIMGT